MSNRIRRGQSAQILMGQRRIRFPWPGPVAVRLAEGVRARDRCDQRRQALLSRSKPRPGSQPTDIRLDLIQFANALHAFLGDWGRTRPGDLHQPAPRVRPAIRQLHALLRAHGIDQPVITAT